jgi:hypothetical protein
VERYKILLPLKDIVKESVTVNLASADHAHHWLFLELGVAPHLWKKSDEIDEDDLKDRLSWTEHEQWIRQIDIAGDTSDPSCTQMDTRIFMDQSLPIGIIFIRFAYHFRSLEDLLAPFLCGQTGHWGLYW